MHPLSSLLLLGALYVEDVWDVALGTLTGDRGGFVYRIRVEVVVKKCILARFVFDDITSIYEETIDNFKRYCVLNIK